MPQAEKDREDCHLQGHTTVYGPGAHDEAVQLGASKGRQTTKIPRVEHAKEQEQELVESFD